MSCICTVCGIRYRVDLNIPDYLWERISQIRGDSGLLCGLCIMKHIESMSEHDYWNLNKEKNNVG